MKIKNLYREVLMTSLLLNFFDSMLTAIAVFSAGYMLINFYRINYIWAVIAASIIFAKSLYSKLKQNKINIIEQQYPELKERLRTSFDYRDKNNTIIDDLHSEIIRMMKKVDVIAFLNSNHMMIKVGIICVSLVGTLYMASVGMDYIDVAKSVTSSSIFLKSSEFARDLFDQDREYADDRPLLDDPRLVAIGDRDVNISIDTYNTDIDINEITDPEKNDYGGHYPEEIAGAAQEVYDEKIPEEHKDIVKEYFKKITS